MRQRKGQGEGVRVFFFLATRKNHFINTTNRDNTSHIRDLQTGPQMQSKKKKQKTNKGAQEAHLCSEY